MSGPDPAEVSSARRYRLVLGLVLGGLLTIALTWAFLAAERDRSIDALMERNQLTLSVSWAATQALQRNSVATYFEEYVLNPRTLEILQAAMDPERIAQARLDLFRHLTPAYERMLERGVRQFHFHRPNGDSFLRFHHPSRFGDNLFEMRESIRRANTELEPVYGFEVGRVVSGYRSVFPIIDDRGVHLGSVELSMPFKVLLEELKALMPAHEFQLLLEAAPQREILFDEQQSLYEPWPASDRFLVEDPFRLRPDSPPPLPPAVHRVIEVLGQRPDPTEALLDERQPGIRVSLEGRSFAVLRTPVTDPGEQQVGLLVAYIEEPGLAMIDRAFHFRLLMAGVSVSAVFVMLYLLLRLLHARLGERNRLKIVTDTMGQGLYLSDAQGRIISMNPQACAMLGYDEKFVVGRSAHDLLHTHRGNEFLAEKDCPVQDAVRAGNEFRGEAVFECAGGRLIEVALVSRPFHDDSDGRRRHAGAVTVFEDIGERKQAERELAESRRRLADIVWGAGVGTWEWNVQTGELRVNERWAEIIGYRLAELEPTSIATWERMAHPDDLVRSEQALQRHFSGKDDHYEAELRMRHRAGHWVWVFDRGRVVSRTDAGEPEWVVGTHLDISARKQAERQSIELLERFRKLTAEMPGFVYQFRLQPDGAAALVYASAGIREISGLDPSEVEGNAEAFLKTIHTADAGRVRRSIVQSAERLTPWYEVFRVFHPERGTRWVEGNSTPDRQADGSTIWHGYIHDVTQRRAAELSLEESEAKYRNLVENAPVILFRSEPTPPWRMHHISRSVERVCGYPPHHFIDGSMPWVDLVLPEDLPALERVIAEALAEGHRYETEYRVRHADGSIRWVSEIGSVRVVDEVDGQKTIEGVISDITDRRQAELAAREAQKLLQAALESSPSGIIIANASDGSTRFSNEAVRNWLGTVPNLGGIAGGGSDELPGWQVLRPDGTPMPEEELPLQRALHHGEVVSGNEAIIQHADGRQRWLSISAAPIEDEFGQIGAGIVVFSDISEQKAAQAELRHRAHYDALTGLPNRVLLADRLEQAMQRARRTGQLLAVAFIDLDEFKPINDIHGHAVGDQLLIRLSRRMRHTLREVDTLARLGGDEFVAVLSDLQVTEDGQVLLERLIQELSRPVELGGLSLRVTGSIGMTFYPQEDELDADQLLRQADQAMYRAKVNGRNRWHFFKSEVGLRKEDGGAVETPPRLF
ncbi:MAG: PAS domain-containing protein [Wenzhouxiangella sp.]|nr:PAS domain-containing protein [Wenzhouxiangella sp.]